MSETKVLRTASLKATPEGVVEAYVAIFGNVDYVKDRIVQGAFTKSLDGWRAEMDQGKFLPFVWSHKTDDPKFNIGKVVDFREDDTGLWVKAKLFLTKQVAQDAYNDMKEGIIDGFSFAYDILRAKAVDGGIQELLELGILECGPTMYPANDSTYLVGVKAAIGSHSTATTDSPWDGPAAKANLSNAPSALRQAFAWFAGGGADPAAKSSYKFIHHMVNPNASVGAANVTACSTGIGVLNGGRTGTTIPDADRSGVHAHLAKHLADAGQEPPPLKSIPEVEFVAVKEWLSAHPEFRKELEDNGISYTITVPPGTVAVDMAVDMAAATSTIQPIVTEEPEEAKAEAEEPAPAKVTLAEIGMAHAEAI